MALGHKKTFPVIRGFKEFSVYACKLSDGCPHTQLRPRPRHTKNVNFLPPTPN